MNFGFLEEFGKAFVPKNSRPTLSSYLAKAGIDEVPYKFFGALFFVNLVITYLLYLMGVYPVIKQSGALLFFILTFLFWFVILVALYAVVIVGIYFYLNLMIYQRTKMLEELLADYLSLVATNLKGGMNFEKSLWSAIKSDFGILSKEIGIVSKKVATGNDVIDALEDFSRKYDSPVLRRSIDLLKGEILSGGKIADVIDNIVKNLKKTKALKQEMSATSLSYIIFLSIIVLVITPALFALSRQLLVILLSLGSKISTGTASSSGLGFSFTPAQISPDQFTLFSVFALLIIGVFSSLIISIIEKGDVLGGIRYVPLFSVVTVVFYFIFATALGMVMKGLV